VFAFSLLQYSVFVEARAIIDKRQSPKQQSRKKHIKHHQHKNTTLHNKPLNTSFVSTFWKSSSPVGYSNTPLIYIITSNNPKDLIFLKAYTKAARSSFPIIAAK
jgi:hypothetical protein